MKLIKPDYGRRVEIAGVPEPVQRPVDVDRSQTGFTNLRSLRIYCFDKDAVIHGHAEEDEVLIVILTGSVELSMMDHDSGEHPQPLKLSAADDTQVDPCAAYLPPQAAYRLVAQNKAEVAYGRATPAGGRPSRVFRSHAVSDHSGVTILLEENNYPQRLRLRILQITAAQHDVEVSPMQKPEDTIEGLIHVRTKPPAGFAAITREQATPTELASWDTVAVMPGDCPVMRFKAGSTALILIVSAA